MAKSMTILIVIMFITTPAPAIPTWLHIKPGLVEGYCLCSRCNSNENLGNFSISTPNTLAQNGKIERNGWIITTWARTTLIAAKLPPFLWAHAEEYAVRVMNLLPTKANPDMKSPQQMMAEYLRFSNPYLLTSIRHLRTFGYVAYVYLKGYKAPPKSHKIAPRAEKGFLVGTKGFNSYIYLV